MSTPNEDPYPLERDFAATARLNLQHFAWRESFGYLVHPNIPTASSDLKIAEVGTGTGIWLLDLARQLPTSAQLEGLDLDLSQTPPQGWLPPNISFRQYNVFDEPPKELVEKYDIIHARFLYLVVQKDNPVPILSNLMKMLKPGGYIQWGEQNPLTPKVVKSDPANPSDNFYKLWEDLVGLLGTGPVTWPAHLEQTFKEQKLESVLVDSRWTPDAYLSFSQANLLLISEEMINRNGGSNKGHLKTLLAQAGAESRKGMALSMEALTTVGRKPL